MRKKNSKEQMNETIVCSQKNRYMKQKTYERNKQMKKKENENIDERKNR